MKKEFFLLALSCCLATAPVAAQAETPAKTVKTTVEQVQSTVREKEGKVSAAELEQMLREIISPVFNFREMSRRSLGANWKKATAKQQEEFVDLFSELLAKNYLKKIRENVASSNMQITGEKSRGKKALVKTVVDYGEETVKIDYRLHTTKSGKWMVYDVIIENIGLVSNYRSEFAGIVKKDGVAGLIERLKKKEDSTAA